MVRMTEDFYAMNIHPKLHPVDETGEDLFPVSAKTRRRRLMLIVAIIGSLLVAIGAWLVAGGGAGDSDVTASAPVPRVTVMAPGRQAVVDEVRVTGTISARRDMPVGVQGEGGMVTAVLAEAGDEVRAGQLLARIDRAVQTQQVAQLRAALEQARADEALAQSELDRALTLVEKGFISKADIDRRTATRDANRARVDVVAAQLREAQARLARLDIRAPDDGLVLERAVETGQIVGPGSPALFRIAQNGAMEMKAQVAEQDMPKLAVKQKAMIRPVGSTREFEGEIWLLEPLIDQQSRQGEARIALPRDPLLRPGAFARGAIRSGTADRPVLPQSAVLTDNQGSYVYVVGADNRVERQAVTIGSISSQGMSIIDGLQGSERVIVSAGAFLRPGEKVDPVSAPARVETR